MRNPHIIVLGGGYIGRKMAEGLDCQLVDQHIEKYDDLEGILKEPLNSIGETDKKPVLINCIGKTGRPNVDWCEDHGMETFHANVFVPYMLAMFCVAHGVKLVHLSSGCIYNGGDKEYSEDDEPNFQGSFYSFTKYTAERMLLGHVSHGLDVLILRLRMPVDSVPSERNLINKLLKYDKIIMAKNSITIIPDFIELTGKLIDRDASGIINCVNPDPVYHNQIVNWYEIEAGVKLSKQYIEPEELDVKAPRSNCVLVDKRLQEMGLQMPSTVSRMKEIIKEYIQNERGN